MSFYRDNAMQNAEAVLRSNDSSDAAKTQAQSVISTIESLDVCGAKDDDYANVYSESTGLI